MNPATEPALPPDRNKQQYVRQVLQQYLALPHTPARYRRRDRQLAEQLWARGVRLQDMEMAMLLATGRRLARSPEAPALGPIRSLHYFLPVLDEVTQQPLPKDYLHYLRRKVAELKP